MPNFSIILARLGFFAYSTLNPNDSSLSLTASASFTGFSNALKLSYLEQPKTKACLLPVSFTGRKFKAQALNNMSWNVERKNTAYHLDSKSACRQRISEGLLNLFSYH